MERGSDSQEKNKCQHILKLQENPHWEILFLMYLQIEKSYFKTTVSLIKISHKVIFWDTRFIHSLPLSLAFILFFLHSKKDRKLFQNFGLSLIKYL